jgi:hypothetical protein
MATGGAARRLRTRGGGPGVEDAEHPPNSMSPGPHPIVTLRALACRRLALPVVIRRASMRWPIGASVALVRPVQEDGGREPAHTAIIDRQVCGDPEFRCCNELRLISCVQQRFSRSRALTFGKAKFIERAPTAQHRRRVPPPCGGFSADRDGHANEVHAPRQALNLIDQTSAQGPYSVSSRRSRNVHCSRSRRTCEWGPDPVDA